MALPAAPVVGGIAGTMLAVLLLAPRRRWPTRLRQAFDQSPRSRTLRAFGAVSATLTRTGVPARRPWETPREYAQRAGSAQPAMAARLLQLAALAEAAAFDGEPIEETASEAADRLARAIRQLVRRQRRSLGAALSR